MTSPLDARQARSGSRRSLVRGLINLEVRPLNLGATITQCRSFTCNTIYLTFIIIITQHYGYSRPRVLDLLLEPSRLLDITSNFNSDVATITLVMTHFLHAKKATTKSDLASGFTSTNNGIPWPSWMIWVYPIYFFAFTSMPSFGRSVFTLVLPLIKLAFKNYFSHVLRQLDDIKPAFVVFNADVFSALYVVNCLQASRSGVNLLLVMLVDIVQMAVSIHDHRVVLREVRSLVRLDQYEGSILDLCVASNPNDQGKLLQPTIPIRWKTTTILPTSCTKHPATPPDVSKDTRPQQRTRLVHSIAKARFCSSSTLSKS